MGLFDSAKDSFKGAVGNGAEGSVDGVRDAVAEVLRDQLENLLGKTMVTMLASVLRYHPPGLCPAHVF